MRFSYLKDNKFNDSVAHIASNFDKVEANRIALKKGDWAKWGVDTIEIMDVDGDKVYAKFGPNVGWYDKDEFANLGVKFESKPEEAKTVQDDAVSSNLETEQV